MQITCPENARLPMHIDLAKREKNTTHTRQATRKSLKLRRMQKYAYAKIEDDESFL